METLYLLGEEHRIAGRVRLYRAASASPSGEAAVRQEGRPRRIRSRPGWSATPAVRDDRITEIKSSLILQPGPAALTDGLGPILAALRGPAG